MKGRSLTGTAVAIGLPRDAIRSVLTGHDPRLSRVIKLCEALGLKIYIDQGLGELEQDENTEQILKEILSRLPPKKKVMEAMVPYHAPSRSAAHHIPVYEAQALARGALREDRSDALSYFAFRHDWLAKRKIDPKKCLVMHVSDQSMEPTLAKHSAVLVDRTQRRRQVGRIYVIRTDKEVTIRRLGKVNNQWQLISDHPKLKPTPFPAKASVIGVLRWVAKTLDL